MLEKIKSFIKKYFFNTKWRCLSCGKEIFNEKEYFCDKCSSKLPFNDQAICEHCGRSVLAPEGYCSTCKNKLVDLDKCRSVFNYQMPINKLIKNLKYDNARYLVDYFSERLSLLYLKNYFNADLITFVPMTERARKKRGYNQSELLAKALSNKVGVECKELLVKVKETKRQARLKKNERLENLKGAFKVSDKKSIKERSILIVDDVTTTGATSQIIAERLKKAGAKRVYLLTIASVPPVQKY